VSYLEGRQSFSSGEVACAGLGRDLISGKDDLIIVVLCLFFFFFLFFVILTCVALGVGGAAEPLADRCAFRSFCSQ
jgi:hypothetical protein